MRNVHAFSDDALGDFDTIDLTKRLAAREVSAVELVEAAIARAEMVNPALNGLAYAAYDRARSRATAVHGGFFDGIPTFLKDNVTVAGMPTMHGTDAWAAHPATVDGDFARAYLATGLIALGKTQLSEFGFSAAAEHPRLGAVRNPWDTEYTAGASSSGSGAFVAAGVVPIAHANDGGGSIRIPASCNGLVGLKPTRGRIPLDRDTRSMPIRIVYNGVLTRSVRNTAAFYREIERIWPARKLAPVGDLTRPGKQRLKIGVVTRSLVGEASADVREQTMKTAELLEGLGHHVEHLGEPPVSASFADDFRLYWATLAAALVKGGRQMFGPTFDENKLDNLTLGLSRYAIRHVYRLPLALTRLALSYRATRKVFQRYDVVLTPTTAFGAPKIGHFDPTADR